MQPKSSACLISPATCLGTIKKACGLTLKIPGISKICSLKPIFCPLRMWKNTEIDGHGCGGPSSRLTFPCQATKIELVLSLFYLFYSFIFLNFWHECLKHPESSGTHSAFLGDDDMRPTHDDHTTFRHSPQSSWNGVQRGLLKFKICNRNIWVRQRCNWVTHAPQQLAHNDHFLSRLLALNTQDLYAQEHAIHYSHDKNRTTTMPIRQYNTTSL